MIPPREYRLTLTVVIPDAEHPRDAVQRAKAELRLLLDSDAPLTFDWVSYEDGLQQARATTTLNADGTVESSTPLRPALVNFREVPR